MAGNLRIEDYALIGDCVTAALVGNNGSIDWLCLPRFDSGACFAALLGRPEHGRWRIAPAGPEARVRRHYRGGSLILETEFDTSEGSVELIDFMPMPRIDGPRSLVRLVRGKRGRVAMRLEFVLRFDYGSIVPWVERLNPAGGDTGQGGIVAVGGPDMAVLRTRVPLVSENMRTRGEFAVGEGETIPFVLSYGPSHLPPPAPLDGERALRDTAAFWDEWSGRCMPAGQWSEEVGRSLAVLKGLTFAPTGGIVAAPTTSLPERLGGVRNWDYRFCWLRDATFTLLALMHAGYYDEAKAWRDWLFRAAAGSPDQLQVVYGLAGERRLDEWELSSLPGYEGSRPVRIGNAAADQLQLDIYGEVIDALHLSYQHDLPQTKRGVAISRALVDHLATTWRRPDESIWEGRGSPRHFTYSKVMAWVAFDRAIRIFEELGVRGPLANWRRVADEIHRDICKKAFDPGLNSFVQAYGSKSLDASLLLLPLVGFLPPTDPRLLGTVAAIERDLMCDGFVLRYRTEEGKDGLPPGEGAFLACSFWLADNLALQGRLGEARALFERLLAVRNDVGLFAEQYDPRSRRFTGNFPQAFSHVALVNTAFNLSRAEGPGEERAGRRKPAGIDAPSEAER
ncbi:MAG TPA: glycoside hydrolase family 15 protein [Stellaceae bacterium]|nr:glycoside hydrolase family 15 protein [Stellaceae bacterium]